MDNNVSKSTFFSQFFKSHSTNYHVSIKLIILQRLLQVIRVSQRENCLTLNWDQIVPSLSEKIVLQNDLKFLSLVYSAAIVFPLANSWGLSPLEMANQLVSLLSKNGYKSSAKCTLNFTARVFNSGRMDFILWDLSIGFWLQQIVVWISSSQIIPQLCNANKTNQEVKRVESDLFVLQYVHARCCSLLSLGATEGLIGLKDSNFVDSGWQIITPDVFLGYNSPLFHSKEINLLRQISLAIDLISDRYAQNTQTWIKLSLSLSQAWLEFTAACSFCGAIAKKNPDLAVFRLGLTAIVQWCLQTVMSNHLGMTPLIRL